jgi:hypothetical protein
MWQAHFTLNPRRDAFSLGITDSIYRASQKNPQVGRRMVDALIAVTKQERNPIVIKRAVRELGRYPSKRSVAVLRTIADGKNPCPFIPEIRQEARRALTIIQYGLAIEAIIFGVLSYFF